MTSTDDKSQDMKGSGPQRVVTRPTMELFLANMSLITACSSSSSKSSIISPVVVVVCPELPVSERRMLSCKALTTPAVADELLALLSSLRKATKKLQSVFHALGCIT